MGKIYLSNAFSLQMISSETTSVNIQEASLEEIQNAVKGEYVSIMGHADTANIVSRILRVNIPVNRVSITLEKGDILYVAQVMGGRLPEGCTILPKDTIIKFFKVTT